MTGFDPKVFVQELKTEIVLNGLTPDYIVRMLENYQNTGNAYGAEACKCLDELFCEKSETLLFVGQDALYKSPASVKNAVEVLKKAGEKVALTKEQDSGAALWFLTGKTQETQNAAKACAEKLNGFKKVIVYDPADLKLFLHGGSGVPDDQIQKAVKAGICKINFGTDLCYSFLDAVFGVDRSVYAIDLFMYDPIEAVKKFAVSKIQLLGANGRV